MREVEGGRYCFACKAKVVDLNGMSAEDVEALLIASGEDLCGEVDVLPGAPMFPTRQALLAAGVAASLMVQACATAPEGTLPPLPVAVAQTAVAPIAEPVAPTVAAVEVSAPAEAEQAPNADEPCEAYELEDAQTREDAGPRRFRRRGAVRPSTADVRRRPVRIR
jgi:hypothetical protein